MDTIVVKFGGTSVATEQNRMLAIAHIKRMQEEQKRVVVVVSAMGRKGSPYATDTLLSLLSGKPNLAVRDLLLSCGETISACVFADELEQSGIRAAAFTGVRAGILTDSSFGKAEIFDMDTLRVWCAMHEGCVPVITGFQGANVSGEVTTLGRGGSDTSAVAIGGFLGAKEVVIYTDVPGVAIIDPRIVPEAPFFKEIAVETMLSLAHWGAGVIHPRAVAAAARFDMDVWVKSTFDEKLGTRISKSALMKGGPVGIACLNSCRIAQHMEGERIIYAEHQPYCVLQDADQTMITIVFSSWDEDKIKSFVQPAVTTNARCFFSNSCVHVLVSEDTALQTARTLYDYLFI